MNLCDHRLKRQGAQLVSTSFSNLDNLDNPVKPDIQQKKKKKHAIIGIKHDFFFKA